MMKRDLYAHLTQWKDEPDRQPLLIRGARQVGKTTLVKQFAEQHFEYYVELNFEFRAEYIRYFDTLVPEEIINRLRLNLQATIIPGKTLLFLDEVQQCPRAILALRYFYEKMPALHVIAAGSLIEFALSRQAFEMPVGRIQYFYLRPLSFMEFLSASGYHNLRAILNDVSINDPLDATAHEHLLKCVQQYMAVSGMPKPVANFLKTRDMSQCVRLQSTILRNYQDDFAKYAKNKAQYEHLETVYRRLPRIIAQDFQFKQVDSTLRASSIRFAIEQLEKAGLVLVSHAVSAAGIPLGALVRAKKFKLFMLDIGLVSRACGLSAELQLGEDKLFVNRGVLAEQFVAQELVAYASPYEPCDLFWWHRDKRGSMAEVDFVIAVDEHVVPIEVKSGTTGRLRSIKLFMQEKQAPIGIRVSQHPLAFENNILSVPFYLVSVIDRLYAQVLAQGQKTV